MNKLDEIEAKWDSIDDTIDAAIMWGKIYVPLLIRAVRQSGAAIAEQQDTSDARQCPCRLHFKHYEFDPDVLALLEEDNA